ncbi:nucleotidyl transferase AbiEii/AbiGii toxin family protein [Nocardioidaceae bacterium]|nr:nucleotidyl transferase AbiEii/AbiGii toxin family protein [Nocardioidaceae bacterium]
MAEVLSMLNAPLLAEHNCWFGGGTAIVLVNGEFRESVDIDFLVSDPKSYRELRQIVRDHGLAALATRELDLGRTPAVDGYGIRASVLVAGMAIKFEIIHEGRIALDTPSPDDEICGLRILTRTDQVATKLLANDDRWADTSTFSRDLIDLAMMKPDISALKAGARKAVDAYGTTIDESLNKAVTHLQDRPQRLDDYLRALKIDAPRAVVWQSIRDLSARCAKVEALRRRSG